jgi:ABC-2 type transport system ATP-binding protein
LARNDPPIDGRITYVPRVRSLALIAAVLVGQIFFSGYSAVAASVAKIENLYINGAPLSSSNSTPVSLDAAIYMPKKSPAPLILLAHGFGGDKNELARAAKDLQSAGYVVITWSARGFGKSTGDISMDAPRGEVADVSKIIDYAKGLSSVQKDLQGQPIVGISGASYGGALSLLAAGYDHRIKAAVADITWNNLQNSLFPQFLARSTSSQTPGPFKRVWAGTFFAVGAVESNHTGDSPALLCGRFSAEWCTAFQDGAATGVPSTQAQSLMYLSSPTSIAKNIEVPTLLMQGETDSLFPLSESAATAKQILSSHPKTPVSMFWHASGHDGGPDELALINQKTKVWFDHYLKKTGAGLPTFEVVDQTAGISTQNSSPTSKVFKSNQLPIAPAALSFKVNSAMPKQIISPAGAAPFAVSSLPGFGAALSLTGGREAYLPGQSALFASEPSRYAFSIIGGSSTKFHITSSVNNATLFFSMAIRGSDGSLTQPSGLVSSVYLNNIAKNGEDVIVNFPAIVHSVNVGDRLEFAVVSTDLGYTLPTDARVYGITLLSTQISVPTITLTPETVQNSWRAWPTAVGLTFLIALGLVFMTFKRQHRNYATPNLDQRSALVQIVNLSKTFKDGGKAVQDLTFSVEPGQIVGLLGPNGAGKTTTLRMLMGLITPTHGSIYVKGETVYPGSPALAGIGSFIEGPGFIPYLSGRKNLEFYWKAIGRNDDPDLDSLLAIAGLGSAIDKKVKSYSQGMRQRLAITQAMLGRPELLILDEPTNGLDPTQIRAMREVFRNYAASGKTVLISSHLLSEVEQTCTHVVLMHRGKLITQGSIGEILAKALSRSDRLEDVFMNLIGTDTQIGL